MADYTIEIRHLIADDFDFGLTDYPIFDEAYRAHLNTAILMHFYFREIGCETAQMFKFFLNRKMSEIMPVYNRYYESARREYDPLSTISLTEVVDGVSESEKQNNSDTKNNATSRGHYSDTPMGTLNDIYSTEYASSANSAENTAISESETKGKEKGKTQQTRKVTGKNDSRTFGELIRDYRETLVNVDTLIFDELEPLFMQIWG